MATRYAGDIFNTPVEDRRNESSVLSDYFPEIRNFDKRIKGERDMNVPQSLGGYENVLNAGVAGYNFEKGINFAPLPEFGGFQVKKERN